MSTGAAVKHGASLMFVDDIFICCFQETYVELFRRLLMKNNAWREEQHGTSCACSNAMHSTTNRGKHCVFKADPSKNSIPPWVINVPSQNAAQDTRSMQLTVQGFLLQLEPALTAGS